jgi:hypothetical protein
MIKIEVLLILFQKSKTLHRWRNSKKEQVLEKFLAGREERQ